MDHQLQCPLNSNVSLNNLASYASSASFNLPGSFFKKSSRKSPIDPQHPGYIMGSILRGMWDNTFGVLINAYSWMQELRRNHFVNQEAYYGAGPQNINVEECVEERKEQCEKGYPQAVLIRGQNFRDSIEWFIDEVLIELSIRKSLFRHSLAQNHRVHSVAMSRENGLCEMVGKVSKLGPIQFLYISTHGDPAEMALAHSNNPENSIDIWDYFYNNIGGQDLSCLSLLPKGSVIVLSGCNVAGLTTINIYNNSYSVPVNIQRVFALHAFNSRVFAPDFFILKNSIVIKTTPELQVYALASKTEFPYILRDVVTALGYLLGSPYISELVLKKLVEVSLQKAPFCKEVLPYFSMKRFCNNAHKKPSRKALEKCEQDPKCFEAALTLNYVHQQTQNQCKVQF